MAWFPRGHMPLLDWASYINVIIYSCLPWLFASPGLQQPWYWLWKIGKYRSYTRKDLNYLWHVSAGDDIKCKYMCMLPLTNIARKELIQQREVNDSNHASFTTVSSRLRSFHSEDRLTSLQIITGPSCYSFCSNVLLVIKVIGVHILMVSKLSLLIYCQNLSTYL